MHDPMSLAFDFLGVEIWHIDPETDGSDDSCWNGKPPVWNGWKYHFWHWRIKIRFIGKLKRWIWSRCAACGKKFPWGYSPCSNQWDGGGPRWFRGEESVYHHECAGFGGKR